MKHADVLPMPFVSAWDPRTTASGSIDPLGAQQDPLAAVLTVASAFEDLHRELLYRFNQILALDCRRPVPLRSFQFRRGNGSLARLGDALKGALERHGIRLDRSVAEAVRDFSLAVESVVRTRNDTELVRELIRHQERVQAGKLDASRQPKRPWVEVRGNNAVIAPRYALDETPGKPGSAKLAHPYRIEQFTHMLRDAGEWESASRRRTGSSSAGKRPKAIDSPA